MVTAKGGCHCGRVAFEVDAPDSITVQDCNCSICSKTGFLHLIVPKSRFRLLKGEDSLSDYRFDTGEARHLFCSHCGIKSFYIPRSNPDGVSVNLRCVDQGVFSNIEIEPFDGQNWEQNAGSLTHLSRE